MLDQNRSSNELVSGEHLNDDSLTHQGLIAAGKLDSVGEDICAIPDKGKSPCKTFFELPGEIRNIIYGFALFDPGEVNWIFDVWRNNEDRDYDCWWQSNVPTTALLLGAVNKQMRQESRAILWTKTFLMRLGEEAYHHDYLRTFFMMTEGTEIPAPQVQALHSPSPSLSGYAGFQKILSALDSCRGLKELDFELPVSYIFRNDGDALRAHFAGKPLMSAGLENFATIIESLPLLKDLYLDLNDYSLDDKSCNPDQRFFEFAFRGIREVKLFKAVEERLQASQIWNNSGVVNKVPRVGFTGKTYVSIFYKYLDSMFSGDKIMDYETWLEWKEAGGKNWWEAAEVMVTGIEHLQGKEAKDDWSLGLEGGTLIRGRIFICTPDGTCYLDVIVLSRFLHTL
jgi:hypothetical protein